MNEALTLGPLVLPMMVVLALVSQLTAFVVGGRVARAAGLDIDLALYKLLAVTVVASRLAFVWQFRQAYLEAPWSILDIRDGGWEPQIGVIAAWMYALTIIRRQPAVRRALLAGLGSATALWVVGSLVLLALPREPRHLPSVALPGFDGQTTSMLSFEGKPTVVNLWATWCPPCRREMPVLQEAQQRYPDVHFVFLNQGESAEQVQRYLAGSRLELRNVLLDRRGEASTQYGRALPTTLFFDAGGKLVDQRVGELSHASLAQRLQVLGARPQPDTAP